MTAEAGIGVWGYEWFREISDRPSLFCHHKINLVACRFWQPRRSSVPGNKVASDDSCRSRFGRLTVIRTFRKFSTDDPAAITCYSRVEAADEWMK
jgi:hypothetical protein